MKRLLIPAFMVLVTFGLAQAAQATACFDWSCNEDTRSCTFDASCSTANPYVWKWQFYWGDGTNTYLEGSPYFTHQYSVNYATVTLKVHSFQTPSLQEVSCEINIRNIVGPPFPTWGRCTN